MSMVTRKEIVVLKVSINRLTLQKSEEFEVTKVSFTVEIACHHDL